MGVMIMEDTNNQYEFEKWQSNILEEYLDNDSSKLLKLIRPLLLSSGGISQMDYDDYIGKSTDLLCQTLKSYDKSTGIPFRNYFKSCLEKRFITWANRDTNRLKRKNHMIDQDEEGNEVVVFVNDVSIDTPVGEDEGTIADFVEDKKNGFSDELLSESTEEYLNLLSDIQKKIAEFIMKNYTPLEIREELNISEDKYEKLISDMKSFEKKTILKHDDGKVEEDKPMNESSTQTFEKSKTDKLSIASIIKKINNRTIRFDHPLQRPSDQWTSVMKGNLISDIIQKNPIPALTFAEQIVNGFQIIWDIDGKQRCTNAYEFFNDGFKISKKVRRGDISYQTTVKDENGNDVVDENGVPVVEIKEFDIRNKKFSQLPDELKDRFTDYNFEIVQYINCTSEDIAYHIARYNEGKPMSSSHKGIIRLGEDFARMVKSISAMPFFKERGGYTVSEAKGTNGAINRVVIESIMSSNYLNEWKKSQEEACDFLRENATQEIFENFEDVVDRLTNVCTDEVAQMFDSKDSLLYFGLFARFNNTGLDDKKFVEFMAEFSRSLHNKEIDGVTYDSLCVKEDGAFTSNKDKNVAISKIGIIEKLMNEYLHINIEETEQVKDIDFIHENVSEEVITDDIDFYNEILDGLTLNVDNDTKLLEDGNHNSLLGIVAFSCINDIDLDDWFVDYFGRNTDYIKDQKQNYEKMCNDLQKYIDKNEEKMTA